MKNVAYILWGFVAIVVQKPIFSSEKEESTIFYRIFMPLHRNVEDEERYLSIAVPSTASLYDLFKTELTVDAVLYHKHERNALELMVQQDARRPFSALLTTPAEWTASQVKEQIRQESPLRIEAVEGPYFPKFKYILLLHNDRFQLFTAEEFFFGVLESNDATHQSFLEDVLTDSGVEINWVKRAGWFTGLGLVSYLCIKRARHQDEEQHPTQSLRIHVEEGV